jgi:hypothetical protein
MDDSSNKDKCARCGGKLDIRIISRINEKDIICVSCYVNEKDYILEHTIKKEDK